MFNVTYWPYIQISPVYNCINYFFGESWYNLNLDYAQLLIIGSIFGMITAGILIL